MTAALVLAGLGLLLQSPTAPDSGAFLEVHAPREQYFAGEPVPVTLLLGAGGEFLATRMVQPFRRPLDLPVQVDVPWLAQPPQGVRVLPAPPPPEGVARRSFVLNGAVVEGTLLDGTGDRTAVALEVRLLAEQPGPLALAPAVLRYAFASRFREDLIGGRMAEDRQDAVLESPPLALDVLPLPAEGRPPDFTGAVGRFTVEARAEPRELELGEHLKLHLTVRGEGHLESFAPPALADLEGFHAYGWIEDAAPGRRTVTYELAPTRVVDAIPPLSFVYFDPTEPPGYRRAETAAIALRVHAPDAGAPALVERDAAVEDAGSGVAAPLAVTLVLAGAGIGFLLGVLLGVRRARGVPTAKTPAQGKEAPLALLRTRIDAADPGAALAEYLAARLPASRPAVIAPDLSSRLASRGVPEDLAHRCAATLEALVAARYGGPRTVPPSEVEELVARLHPFLDASPHG